MKVSELLNEITGDKKFDSMMGKITAGDKPKRGDLMSHFGSAEYNKLRDMGIRFMEKPSYWSDLDHEMQGYKPLTDKQVEKAERALGVPFKIYTQDKLFTGKKSSNEEAKNGVMPLADANLPKEPIFIVHFKDGSRYLVDGTQANSYIRMWAKIT